MQVIGGSVQVIGGECAGSESGNPHQQRTFLGKIRLIVLIVLIVLNVRARGTFPKTSSRAIIKTGGKNPQNGKIQKVFDIHQTVFSFIGTLFPKARGSAVPTHKRFKEPSHRREENSRIRSFPPGELHRVGQIPIRKRKKCVTPATLFLCRNFEQCRQPKNRTQL